jgi:hypothetical protein
MLGCWAKGLSGGLGILILSVMVFSWEGVGEMKVGQGQLPLDIYKKSFPL